MLSIVFKNKKILEAEAVSFGFEGSIIYLHSNNKVTSTHNMNEISSIIPNKK